MKRVVFYIAIIVASLCYAVSVTGKTPRAQFIEVVQPISNADAIHKSLDF